MKKILIITALLFFMIGGSVKADGVQIYIHTASITDNRDKGPIRHLPAKSQLPTVALDENTIIVQTSHKGQPFYMELQDEFGEATINWTKVNQELLFKRCPKCRARSCL